MKAFEIYAPGRLMQMPEVAHETRQEFWRPPSPEIAGDVVVEETIPAMAEACPRCGTEFLLGSRFCHTCGDRRPEAMSAAAKADAAAFARLWEKAVGRIQSLAASIPWSRMWGRVVSAVSTIKLPAWLRDLHFPDLHFQAIKQWLGLPTASLIAFAIGVCCVAGALLVGLLTANTLVDWQAIQFYRAEWLLASIASFVAGILLKKPSGN
jgi:hypothetical protein